MRFFGKGSIKFYQANKAIIDAIIASGNIGKQDYNLPGGSRTVHRNMEKKIVAKKNTFKAYLPDKGLGDFMVPTVISGKLCFQPLVDVNFDDRASFRERAEKILGKTVDDWYRDNHLPDRWIENIGIHDGQVKLIDW